MGVRPIAGTLATRLLSPQGPSIHVSVQSGGYWTMQIGIDTWFLESLFARFKLAGRLVDNIDDPIVADELAKSINEVNRRLAELLGKPYDPQAAGDPSGSQAAGDPTEDGEPDELELANLLDDLCWSVARADTFTSAAESLIRELVDEDRDDRRFARLAELVASTADAILQADDVGGVLAVKFAQRRRGRAITAG